MPTIYRMVSNYQGPFVGINTVPNESNLRCRKLDLYRSIVTVGNPSFFTWQSIRQFGIARALYDSIFEKVMLVAANIQSDLAGMRRHPIFDTYITDKKRIVSYNLGMAFGKFYSEKILGIPNLIHVEFLKKSGVITFVPQPGNNRPEEPDLVGQTPDGNWHVVEAKGVSTSESKLPGKIAEAKRQIQQIAAIHGVPPTTGNACATYIGRDRIFTLLEDPPANGGTKIELDREKFYDAYYAPFLLAEGALQTQRRRARIDGLDVEFFDLERASRKIRIGLDSEIAELVMKRSYDLSQGAIQRLRKYSAGGGPADKYSIGLDGFVVGYTDY